jgi:protease I
MGKLTGKKVLVVLAPKDFQDEEFFKGRIGMQAAGAEVSTASWGTEEATGMANGKARINVEIKQARAEDYDAFVFIGGSGAKIYFKNKTVLNLVRQAAAQKKILGAICIAPSILANAGVLKGKKVTACPSEAKNLSRQGAVYSGRPIEVDGKIITAMGPAQSEKFGDKLLKILS